MMPDHAHLATSSMMALAYVAAWREVDSALVAAKVGPLVAKHVAVVDPLPIGVAATGVPNTAPLAFHPSASEGNCHPAEDVSLANQKVVEEEGHPYIHSSCLDPYFQEEALLVCTSPSAVEHPALAAIHLQVLHMVGAVVDPAIPCTLHLVACAHLVAVGLHREAAERDAGLRMAVFDGIQEEDRSCFLAFLLLGLASQRYH